MPGTPWRARLAALGATTAIVVAACGGAATPTPAPATAAPTPAPATETPFEAMSYPTAAEVDCAGGKFNGKDYTGNFKKVTALDAKTVVFELCSPDVAFLSKIAFSSFAINDTAWLESKVDPAKTENQAIVSEVNGTGPYKLKEWKRGSEIVLEAFDGFWGTKALAPTAVFRWSSEASQRLTELQAGTVDGIDNVGPTDFATVQADANLALKEREGLNVFYVGFNNTYAPFDNEKVRQAVAQGIDRERIIKNFYPVGSEAASHFTPCSIPNGCAGDPWYTFDAAAAKALLGEAGFPNGFSTTITYRNVVRSYLPDPNVVAQDLQAQLKQNLGIEAKIVVQESGTFLDNSDAGKIEGIHLLGWGADYPDATNFLDYHFGAGSSLQFGNKFDDITAALKEGAAGTSDEARKPAYERANNAIRQHVPMIPVAHGGSAVAYRADVAGGFASPLGNEILSVMKPGDRAQIVFMQNAEPPGLYCADESDGEALRVCEQMLEALYSYEIGGTAAEPALAEKCEPNTELTVWTCTLRDGVKFHDGATLDANDVVLSYAVQWDAEHPLHKGRDGSFSYFPGLFGGFLNPPPPAE
ncbi:MAG: ABC transporter substrate-binding protein [Chloroflexota bacterium]